MENIFKGLFDSALIQTVSVDKFLICILSACLIGIIIALLYKIKTSSTPSFIITLALIPTAVCMVIMMVNGNVGAGVAVAGAFSLIRFRSAPGTAREIVAIFIAMASGLACGMGYIAYGALFGVIASVFNLALTLLPQKRESDQRTLKITVPEDLNFAGAFDGIFEKYLSEWVLTQVKTTNMGSLYRLTYNVTLKNRGSEKEMIDELRCRNGNLEIMLSVRESTLEL